jgi:hypothetical protein
VAGPSDVPRKPPMFLCQVCGEGIRHAENVVVHDALIAHKECLEGSSPAVHPLSADERARLIRHCYRHQVAVCGQCGRDYGVMELGADILSNRCNLCPFCRIDLTWSIRQHIAVCGVVRVADPQWQVEAGETLARARDLTKAGQQLRDTTALTRVESEVLRAQARQIADAARQAKDDSRRIKRSEPPPGK